MGGSIIALVIFSLVAFFIFQELGLPLEDIKYSIATFFPSMSLDSVSVYIGLAIGIVVFYLVFMKKEK